MGSNFKTMKYGGVFYVICFLYFMISSCTWIAYLVPPNIVLALTSFVLLFICYVNGYTRNVPNNVPWLLIILLILSIWTSLTIGVISGIIIIFYYLPAIILLLLPYKGKINLLRFITKWFGIIMVLSISIFFVTKITNLPNIGIFQVPDDIYYAPYKNYFFFIESTNILKILFYRFNGPFLEPGHLAMVSSLILFANRYNFKVNRWLWVSLVCVIISLSLSGYIITIIGYLLLKLKSIRHIIVLTLLFVSAYIFTTQVWNNGDNIMNDLIVARMEYDEEKGIAGNNRTFGKTDENFKLSWEQGKLWTGLGTFDKNDDSIAGAGYKIYFLRSGIISAILVFIFYLNLIPHNCNKRYGYSFIVIIVLLFLQRAYPTWFSWLLCFTLGTACNIGTKSSRLKRKTSIKLPSNREYRKENLGFITSRHVSPK